MVGHCFVQLAGDLFLAAAQLSIPCMRQSVGQFLGHWPVDPADALKINIDQRQPHACDFWIDRQVAKNRPGKSRNPISQSGAAEYWDALRTLILAHQDELAD